MVDVKDNKELIKALHKAMSEMNGVVKEGKAKAGAFSYTYAKFEDVLDAIKGPLHNNGLIVIQRPRMLSGEFIVDDFIVETLVMHESGQYISAEYPLRPLKEDPQGYGSALTYAKRYSLMSIFCLPAEDDDGQAASIPSPYSKKYVKYPDTPSTKPISGEFDLGLEPNNPHENYIIKSPSTYMGKTFRELGRKGVQEFFNKMKSLEASKELNPTQKEDFQTAAKYLVFGNKLMEQPK